jgi:urate oxidase
MLAHSAYGKSRVRLVHVSRHGDRHDLRDLTVAIRFEGDYDESYTDGDNAGVLPTDTMKNTVYALAAPHAADEPEAFALVLATHFLDRNDRLQHVGIDVVEHLWGRIPQGDREYGQAFVRTGPETRRATILRDRQESTIEAGVGDLLILKSSRSAFTGFLRDEFTTLSETEDRLLATSLSATWRYRTGEVQFGPVWRAVRRILLETFAEHDSRSVQHTLHAMGQAVLESIEHIASIHLVMPNKHHLVVDLSRFGLENRNEVFVATEEPHGHIEATLVR